jgi:hypothetical protein
MIIFGVLLLVAGAVGRLSAGWTVGLFALLIGLITAVRGAAGRTTRGRRHWF